MPFSHSDMSKTICIIQTAIPFCSKSTKRLTKITSAQTIGTKLGLQQNRFVGCHLIIIHHIIVRPSVKWQFKRACTLLQYIAVTIDIILFIPGCRSAVSGLGSWIYKKPATQAVTFLLHGNKKFESRAFSPSVVSFSGSQVLLMCYPD